MKPKITQDFKNELDVFDNAAHEATQYFHAELTIGRLASDNPQVRDFLNQTPLFWHTCTGALQMATVVTLGRIFDKKGKSRHNLETLIAMACQNVDLFSKAALAERRKGSIKEQSNFDEFIRAAYEPTLKDFDGIKALVKEHKQIYERNYQPLRHQWFAHRGVSTPTEIAALVKNADTIELARMLSFLRSLHRVVSNLFFNGHPVPRQNDDRL
jgi:hypothetical protein